MKTPLPHANFAVSAMVLSPTHLQRYQHLSGMIQEALHGRAIGYERHPAILMWRGHTLALMMYRDSLYRELLRRDMVPYGHLMLSRSPDEEIRQPEGYTTPRWLGDFKFHANQRGWLLGRDPAWYGQWGWTEDVVVSPEWPRS